MEMRYYLEKWIPGDNAAAVEMFVVLLIVGGWIRALFVATSGKRGGLLALLAFNLVFALIAPYDFQFIPMPWPEQTMVIATFVFSLIAIAGVPTQAKEDGGLTRAYSQTQKRRPIVKCPTPSIEHVNQPCTSLRGI